MGLKVAFFIIFFMAFDRQRGMARDVDVLLKNGSVVSMPLKDEDQAFFDREIMIMSEQNLQDEDTIKDRLISFAKRLWKGFLNYIQAETPVIQKRFSREQLQRILNLSMPSKKPHTSTVSVPVEFKPVTENEQLTPNSQNRTNLSPGGLNQTLAKQNTYFRLLQKWKYQLVSNYYDETQPSIVSYVQGLSDIATSLYHTLDKRPKRWYLWKIKPYDTPASDYTTQFLNLYKLTLAYATNGTAYYRNKTILTSVIDGIDFLVTPKRYDGVKYHGYWWHWIIGVPDTFTKILIIIGDKLTQKRRDLYTGIVKTYISNPLITRRINKVNIGAHGSSLAEIILALGILTEEKNAIKLSTDAVVELLKPNKEGSKSFYPDGSFVNENIPYTGLYGTTLLKSVTQIMFITHDTEFQLKSNHIQYLFNIIDRAFIPLIYEGEMIAAVCGRAMSRARSSIGYGSTLLYDLLIISKFALNDTKKKLHEAAKFWMRRNLRYYLRNTRNFHDISVMNELLNDVSIIGEEMPFCGMKLYASMDRFVQRTPDYMLGLALYSRRISAFDATGKENKRGWHTADGMIYLYNDDEVQFNSAYWPTVDPYRLPGTTVDTIPLFDEFSNSPTISQEKWVGGVVNNNQAVIGMSLNKIGSQNGGTVLAMNLRAKKSWFIVEGQIVALGAGITGNTKASIETIVDNRLLNDKLNYLVISNEGIVHYPVASAVTSCGVKSKKHLNAHWILLQENSHKASIGYYFPNKEKLCAISEQRRGIYFDINEQFMSADEFTGDYSKLIIYHGRNPSNVSYAYVMLPGITRQDLKVYAVTNSIIILANTEDIQAVEIKDHNYIGINIWNEFGGNIDGISSNKPVSILKQNKKNEDTYVISDPTQTNSIIKLKIPEFTKVVKMSEGVEYDGEYNIFIINFVNRYGASEQFTVAYVVHEQTYL